MKFEQRTPSTESQNATRNILRVHLSFGTVHMLFSAVPSAGYALTLLVLLVDLPSPITVFPEPDFVMFPDAAGSQAWMPTDSVLPNVGPEEPPPQPVLPGMQFLYNALSILALPSFCKRATY